MHQNTFQRGKGEAPTKIVAFATQGEQSGDAERLRTLLSQLDARMYPFQRGEKGRQFIHLVKFLQQEKPDLVVMEGTGIAGGMALILTRILWKTRYVVSSGDAVGPFVRMFHPVIGLFFSVYERILCRLAAGYIGWTPYLSGRALTFGCSRAMTAPGWAPVEKTAEELSEARKTIRDQLHISDDMIVFGIVGSLQWNPRVGYCYGVELVQAVTRVSRPDVVVLIVGDGDGKPQLEGMAGSELGRRVILTGRVEREQVANYLAAMDVASLPQSMDGVGNFRYTTKLSEYIAASLPILTGQLPMTYDLPSAFWRIQGSAPWDEQYISNLVRFMNRVSTEEICRKRQFITDSAAAVFDKNLQVQNVTAYIAAMFDDTEVYEEFEVTTSPSKVQPYGDRQNNTAISPLT
ncbi:glycosyltransferase [Alicyclobacillus mengziensis]|uniref:Glycosyltransferase n=1 Tax=Alicyclobacillus mengziensis TaxID=2931921 RepID=A0A9X7Z5R3_9BACL|nr:glycosyltransferase [Alicyclobacillus mengziensis]QSO45438.1 glycosyltransferase [Alicyclobacillus mengziensis]